MKKDDLDIGKILLGVISAKFGPGAIGRIGTIAICAMVLISLLAIILCFINPYIAGGLALLTGLLAFYVIRRSFQYAESHPELAAMDGAQISRMIQHQASMRSLEGLQEPPSHPVAVQENPLIEMQLEEPR